MMESFGVQHLRLPIPVILGVDAVHGFGRPWQAPLFPQSIGTGATWAPAAAMAAGQVTANALRATGWVWDFAPVQDLSRDNRWGRTYETWAEEPALAAAMGGAYVRGLQAIPGHGLAVTATVKHFAGYSESINGHDRMPAELPIRYLQATFLPSTAAPATSRARTNQCGTGTLPRKVRRGRFNHPPVDPSQAAAGVQAGRTATLQAARESITLLRNQTNVLPLSPSSKIVVTGPNADNMTYQVGGWSVSWQGPFTSGHGCCEGPPGQIPPGGTV